MSSPTLNLEGACRLPRLAAASADQPRFADPDAGRRSQRRHRTPRALECPKDVPLGLQPKDQVSAPTASRTLPERVRPLGNLQLKREKIGILADFR